MRERLYFGAICLYQTEILESTIEVCDGRMKQGQTEILGSTVEVFDGRMKQGQTDTGKVLSRSAMGRMKQGQTEILESTVEVFDGRMKQGQTEILGSTVEVFVLSSISVWPCFILPIADLDSTFPVSV